MEVGGGTVTLAGAGDGEAVTFGFAYYDTSDISYNPTQKIKRTFFLFLFLDFLEEEELSAMVNKYGSLIGEKKASMARARMAIVYVHVRNT